MDVNGTGYFLLGAAGDFAHRSGAFGWDVRRRAFTLRQAQSLRLPRIDAASARAAWAAATPLVRDPFGQIARIASAGPPPAGAAGEGPGEGAEDGPPQDHILVNAGGGFAPLRDRFGARVEAPHGRLLDLALGGEPRAPLLVAAYSDAATHHGLVLFHLGRRWQVALAPALAEPPVRAIVDRDGLVWCVTDRTLVCCAGGPLPLDYRPIPARFEPEVLNPGAFAPRWSVPLPPAQRPLALTADAERLYLLTEAWPDWGSAQSAAVGTGAQVILTRARRARQDAPWTAWPVDAEVPYAVDLGVFADGRLAALVPREPGDRDFLRRDCPVLELVGTERDPAADRRARLVLERWPRRSEAVPRLVGALIDAAVRGAAGAETGAEIGADLWYQAVADPAAPEFSPRPRPLVPLARPEYRADAVVTLLLAPGRHGLDSGRPDTPWHRVYIDGCIPPGCALRLYAKAYNDPELRTRVPYARQPAPLWNPLGSELPFHAPIAPSRPGESGLFEVLLQHDDGAVRTLTGRYLQLRIRMQSDGHRTPAIHALRVYAPRFSWQEAWLPAFMRQQAGRDGSDATGPANGADVRERLLAACEGLLTPIEGRIAAAEALIHPDTAPAHLLPGLAAVLGVRLPPDWPEARCRRLLAAGCLLQQWRGTSQGLRLALDIATDGGVARGEVVVVEHFRLRRTFATILGLDLDDRDHPLTLGTGISGNSIVGDSLILADGRRREFLALLAPELAFTTATGAARSEAEIVAEFFEQYSNRVSILLHGPARAQRATVAAVLDDDLPAHLQARIIATEQPFVLGLAPLLAVDSFVDVTPPPRRVRLDDTWLGREGVLTNPPALSPRDRNARVDPAHTGAHTEARPTEPGAEPGQ